MADRTDFHFRQKVTEAELDLAFELLENADRHLAADIGVYGIISGAEPSEHQPVPDLTIDLVAPARAYDHLGQRIFIGTDQTIDLSVDHAGIPTEVSSSGNERWLALFLKFERLLSDPRTDGNSQQVFFRRDESFELVVRQAAEEPIGSAAKVPLVEGELLICDVLRQAGQTQILDADIDTSRRQAFIFAQGDAVEIVSGLWNILQPAANNVQAVLNEIDAELGDHFGATARRHDAADIDYTAHGFVGAGNLQAAVDELIDDLSSVADGNPGAQRVGADIATGTPHALPAGNVDEHLSQILSWLNSHVGATSAAHAASAISALAVSGSPNSLPNGSSSLQLSNLLSFINDHINDSSDAHDASAVSAVAHNHIAGTTVQTQLEEIVDDLESQTTDSAGASRIGADEVSGSPNSLSAGTVDSQLSELLADINNHESDSSGAHAASAISVADSGGNLSATNVESALSEILNAVEDDHYRGNETNAGKHKAIHQPDFGTGRVLLWDAAGNGSSGAHLRVYADSDYIWFTLNASWNGSAWARDTSGNYAGGFRFSRSAFELFHDNTFTATFTTWSRTWRIPMSSTTNSAFEMTGSTREVGRLGYETHNTYNATRNMAMGGANTFRSRFPSTPSSITFSETDSYNADGPPSLWDADRDGFGFFDYVNVSGNTTIWWFGTYTAVA